MPQAPSTADLAGLRVLLVEDNPINQQLAVELMESRHVHGRRSPTTDRRRIECINAHPPDHYSVVLMDLQMPVMDGYEATRLLRLDARYVNLPIVAMTAHAMADERERCLVLGMNGHLSKPIDPEILYATLAEFNAPGADVRPGPTTPAATRAEPTPVAADPGLPQIAGLDVRAGLQLCRGQGPLYSQLLQQFARDFAMFAGAFESMLDAGVWEDAVRQAHTLKGLAASLGAIDLQPRAAALELAARAHDHDAVARQPGARRRAPARLWCRRCVATMRRRRRRFTGGNRPDAASLGGRSGRLDRRARRMAATLARPAAARRTSRRRELWESRPERSMPAAARTWSHAHLARAREFRIRRGPAACCRNVRADRDRVPMRRGNSAAVQEPHAIRVRFSAGADAEPHCLRTMLVQQWPLGCADGKSETEGFCADHEGPGSGIWPVRLDQPGALSAAAVDFSVSGFGTLGYARSDQPYSYQRFIDDSGTFWRDSVAGLQVDARFADKFGATVQVKLAPASNNDNAFKGTVSWAFLSWRPTNDWLLRAGKQRIPLYLYSQTVDVGVTYDFARLPTEMYSISPNNDLSDSRSARPGDWPMANSRWTPIGASSRADFRFWLRDDIPPVQSSGPLYVPEDIRGGGLVLSYRRNEDTYRIGVSPRDCRVQDGSPFPTTYPFVALAPGIGYYQVTDALPGPGVPTRRQPYRYRCHARGGQDLAPVSG